MTVTRRDGPDGDEGFSGPFANPGFHPRSADLGGVGGSDFEYEVEIPRVTDVGNLKFVFRADRSAANILCKLDGGIDLNGRRPVGNSDPGFRDNPPAVSTDVFLGYEQPHFVERMGPEKFAARNTSRCALDAAGAESWAIRIGSGRFSRVNGEGNNSTPPDSVQFVYHDPEAALPVSIGDGNHYRETLSSIEIHVKTNSGLGGYKGALYYTLDRSVPLGAGGSGANTSTMAVPMNWVGDSEGGSWWKGTITPRRAGTIRYVAAVRRANVNALFPRGAEEVADKRYGMTVFEIDGFNGETVEFFPHNDYAKTPDQESFVMEAGLDEGFHILRARAFLERTGKASLYNTFQQTFYYDAGRPLGEIVFPKENDILSDQSFEVVVRADASVGEAWFYIEDGVGPNDDDQTGADNGNGPGRWVRASETGADPNLPTTYPREFRFNYANIPTGNVPAALHVRLREATSAARSTWTATVGGVDDVRGWYTTLTRNLTADGPDRRLFVAFPSTDGEVVGDDYVLKAYFSKSLGNGVSDQQLIDEFSIAIGSRLSGSSAGAVNQKKDLLSIVRDETADYHALAFDVPELWAGDSEFLHHVQVSHLRGGIGLQGTRMVRAAEVEEPFVSVVQPPVFDGGGQPWVEGIPDVANPTPGQREIPIRIGTDDGAGHLTITFEQGSGTIGFVQVVPVGTQQSWDYRWTGVSPGFYRIRVDARARPTGSITATTTRDITVALVPSVPLGQDNDSDSLPDWWEIAHGLDTADNGSVAGSAGNGPEGDPDGDGILNFTEFLVGLDPNRADEGDFPSLQVAANPDDSVRLTFPVIPDRYYTVSWSSDLKNWTTLGAIIDTGADVLPATYELTDAGPPGSPSHPAAMGRRFYRLEVALP